MQKFLSVHTLTSKVNDWETKITSISHITFKYIKGAANTLTHCISRLKFMGMYDTLTPKKHVQEFGHQSKMVDSVMSIKLEKIKIKKLQNREVAYK